MREAFEESARGSGGAQRPPEAAPEEAITLLAAIAPGLPESFSIHPSPTSVTFTGADPRGLMYALLDWNDPNPRVTLSKVAVAEAATA